MSGFHHLPAVVTVLLCCVSTLCLAEPASRPIVGAIRWDAWTGGSRVTTEVERSLGPEKYHYRLPWFAQVLDDQHVTIDGSAQAIMDQEINHAADAGIDYWAFVQYDHDNAMSRALANYLASPQRQRLKFCLILHNPFGVKPARWPVERDRTLALLKDPNYQTVLGGRPLVYTFDMKFEGQFPSERFAEFRLMAQEAGLNPYYVYMGWNPGQDFPLAVTRGFDAVSAYAAASKVKTFTQLCQYIETDNWGNAAGAGVPYIPLVSTGWDPSPRNDNPVSWVTSKDDRCVPTATPAEIVDHLRRSLAFVRDNPRICPANAVIMYAWNEHDEGGWLCPTWTAAGPNTGRLDAIRALLKP